jgi:hypothetical protein
MTIVRDPFIMIVVIVVTVRIGIPELKERSERLAIASSMMRAA